MKKIVIVSDSKIKNNRENTVGEHIRANLETIFENRVKYEIIYIDELKPSTRLNGDLFVVMSSARGNIIKNYVEDPSTIIVVRRTFLKESISPLYDIPKNQDVLVVNDDAETIYETVMTLYQIGIRHINLIPFEVEKDYHHLHYALSPSEPDYVPDYIEHIFDIGNRMIDISTILFIMNQLDLQDLRIQNNFFEYNQKLFSLDNNMEENYNQLLVRTDELNCILNLSHDGILLTDQDGKILIFNKIFKQIFDISANVEGHHLNEIIPNVDFGQYLGARMADDLIQYKNKIIKMEKNEITHYNKKVKIYYNFQEVTYIKKLEQNLSQKLRQKGQIAKYTFDDIITSSPALLSIIEKSKKIAQSDLTVLITGESGTGKEVLAQAIHNYSNRKNQPFIAINTAAIPETLLESELFGYAGGSFTGASKEGKKGIFEQANNGTIFLDEIGDMPKHLQAKLLRVLQEKQVTPVGADHVIEVDVRVIAATHKDLLTSVHQNQFRQDLFYRLNVFPVELPPLRERKTDILSLLNHFTNHHYILDSHCQRLLEQYDWPGNIREVGNLAHYISTLDQGTSITVELLPGYIQNQNRPTPLKGDPLINNTIKTLSHQFDLHNILAVLTIIDLLNNLNKSAGRKHILSSLALEGTFIHENHLKKILRYLSESNYIFVKKGRSGNDITEDGLSLMHQLQQYVNEKSVQN